MTPRLPNYAYILMVGILALAWTTAAPVHAAEIPRPEDQLKHFRLPPGFEIQLVASDPDIGQPMNLNFDVRGRLWVTSSVEYPYPAAGEGVQPRPARFGTPSKHAPRDRITIISGIDASGKPKSITHFAEGLNIPIGITPLGDGSEAIGFSIPAMYRFTDEDGDAKSDERKLLYGRFGNVDTHGMSNAYTRWIDGWIYGCHGFSNQSEITDGKGRVTKLRSGNTYRFQEDGSHFQQFTWGQVNPFGLTFDPLGNLYSADCHTKPLYLLLRGAKYPHFGDKPDRLGFGPEMIRHNHGSTGICGPAYYAADHFPAEYRDNLFVCNPVTGRINRDKLQAHGSTYQCVEQPDFVTYDGNVFRPVDLQVGPDGALYIADFCNPVIGHYEAPLDHPDRDRNHGRIWRIIYRGPKGEAPPPEPMGDLRTLTSAELIEKLADPNLQVRTLATNFLVDAQTDDAKRLARAALSNDKRPVVRAHSLWILERLKSLDDETLDHYAEDEHALVRVHATRILAERPKWTELNQHSARLNLFDGDAFVRRAAADALGQHPHAEQVASLLTAWENAPTEDTHLIHTIRLALRNHVRDPAIVAAILKRKFGADAAARLVEIASASDSEVPAPIFLAHADPTRVDREVIQKAATTIAERGTQQQLQQLISLLPKWFPNDPHLQFNVLAAAVDGLQQKGVRANEQSDVKAVVERLAPLLLADIAASKQDWQNREVPDLPVSESPWGLRERTSADGKTDWFWDSISHGEKLTGILRSQSFELPETFAFWICGHNGHPNTPDAKLNYARLVDAKSGEELARVYVPRNDTAKQVQWRLPDHAGKQVALEVVDAHQASAYAWIAVGRFDPPAVRVPSMNAEHFDTRFLQMIGEFQLTALAPQLRTYVLDQQQPPVSREAAHKSLALLLGDDERFDVNQRILSNADFPDVLRGLAAEMFAEQGDDAAMALLEASLTSAPSVLQRRIARALSNSKPGREKLLSTIEAGKASPRLLEVPHVALVFNKQGGEAEKLRREKLLKDIAPLGKVIEQRIIDQYNLSFSAKASLELGQALFKKHCINCHRVGSEGTIIGPQLDGIGNRGTQRILEDILDPNRNVDVAFRIVTLELQSGKIISGIERRRQGKVVVIADQQGKELTVSVGDIALQRRTPLSLMPANFHEVLKPEELNDLIAWLANQKAKDN